VLDPVQPVQVGQRVSQRMAAVEIGLAVCQQHEQRRVRCSRGDVLQQRECLAVRPVQVIEDQQHRALVACRMQEPGHRFEQQVSLGFGIGRLRPWDAGDPLGERTRQEAGKLAPWRSTWASSTASGACST
jgi:hypothetical protein